MPENAERESPHSDVAAGEQCVTVCKASTFFGRAENRRAEFVLRGMRVVQ